jgi:hypothetical protein
MSKKMALVAALLVASSTTASYAQGLFEATPQEQAACRPDVRRFCREFIPDTFRILACLQSHRVRISKACRGVLESHGQ